MAVLGIRIVGDPVLRTPAEEVTEFGPGLARLVGDMLETMDDVDGAGLAAPQIGVALRVFTYRIGEERGYVVNPVLEVSDELQEPGGEGCLSVPGLGYTTPRRRWARVTGVDVDGAPVVVEGEGLLARCLQHETDHLDGRLYIDRLTGGDKKDALRRIRTSGFNGVAAATVAERARSLGSSFGPGSGTTA
ncbi:peptide deformylase [Zafaria sp. Z1313]|uniref:peptide deformylase n=1 Tax=Zafaria sp. Z1313 TaxID=3423202 RepID=UPI003D303575